MSTWSELGGMIGAMLGTGVATWQIAARAATKDKFSAGAAAFSELRSELGTLKEGLAELRGELRAVAFFTREAHGRATAPAPPTAAQREEG